eukprot:136070_1
MHIEHTSTLLISNIIDCTWTMDYKQTDGYYSKTDGSHILGEVNHINNTQIKYEIHTHKQKMTFTYFISNQNDIHIHFTNFFLYIHFFSFYLKHACFISSGVWVW